ncbi:MAG: PAS domain-containing protein, partial [Candidatus Dadabacteria bacterium]|nr:PAS domain-containing protein [Candidatus Dadabacteria bacterium]NIQ16882.1 PAS domain-containing protein [Candidatus Dadabacteria bacterium]
MTEYFHDTNCLSSIAFWLDGDWVDEYEYNISGTPCELVVNEKKLVHVSEKVVDLYPRDKDLKEFDAVSYIGIPLLDADNNVMGNLAVFDSEFMPKQQKIISVISIFASRASAELQRLRAENESREHKEKLARLVEGAMDAIIEIDENLKITQINSATLKIFNCHAENCINKNFATLLSEKGLKKLINTI